MCGWGILVNRDGRPVERAKLQAMADAVAHRGPDAEGIVELGAVGLAHRRLAVIDVNDRSNQPMRSGDNWLQFNGAIYNFRELRTELEALGHIFHTRSDTEVLLHALDQWWVDALPRLQGMFSFCFYDARRRKLLLARDRFGIKPLCYHLSDRVILAGSEAKQLLATGLVGSAPDHSVLRTFLEYGRLNLDERSFFADIKLLPPGQLAVYDLARDDIVQMRWYDLALHVEPQGDIAYGEACERLRALFDDAVRSHHVANVPVGASLSGGIDSSSIAASSAPVVGDPGQFPLFTIYHANEQHDERDYATQVSERFGFRHIEVPVSLLDYYTPEWLESFAWSQDQPLPGGSHFNEHALFKAAHEAGVTVMLDGQGADEYFGGYGEFWLAAQRAALKSGHIAEVGRNLRGRSLTNDEPMPLTARKMVAALARRESDVSPLMAGLWRGKGAARHAYAPPKDFRPLSIDELVRSSIPYQLHSQDRNAMQFGIESRVPFLDHRLVEFVCSLPTDYLVGRGWQKRIFRDAMSELPDAIRWRRGKIGFSSPDAEFGVQYPAQLAAMLDDATATLAPLLDTAELRARLGRYRLDPTRYDSAIFRLISLAAWVRRFAVSL